MSDTVLDTFETYRLSYEALEDFLTEVFGYLDFEITVGNLITTTIQGGLRPAGRGRKVLLHRAAPTQSGMEANAAYAAKTDL